MKDITRKIGEEIDYHGVKLRVVQENPEKPCHGCYFGHDDELCFRRDRRILGGCSCITRVDSTGIVFKKIG